MQTLQTSVDADLRIGVLTQATDAIYVPFLGRVIECSTDEDAKRVANASRVLRSTDFSELTPDEFELIVAALTDATGASVQQAVRERANELRRCYKESI